MIFRRFLIFYSSHTRHPMALRKLAPNYRFLQNDSNSVDQWFCPPFGRSYQGLLPIVSPQIKSQNIVSTSGFHHVQHSERLDDYSIKDDTILFELVSGPSDKEDTAAIQLSPSQIPRIRYQEYATGSRASFSNVQRFYLCLISRG